MKKKITIYLSPIEKELEISDDLDEDSIIDEINCIVFDNADEILNQATIEYWE